MRQAIRRERESTLSDISKIGYNVRSLRKERGITLQQLAEATGLSTGYLSNLERNVNSPTLVNIQKICEALDISLGDMVERNREESIIVRKDEREVVIDEQNSIRLENIDYGLDKTTFTYMSIEPGGAGEGLRWEHDFDEVGTVIKGELTLGLGNQMFHMKEGDTILVKAHTSHCYFNKGTEESVSFWARCRESE